MDALSASTMVHGGVSLATATSGIVHIGALLGGRGSVTGSIGQYLSNKEIAN